MVISTYSSAVITAPKASRWAAMACSAMGPLVMALVPASASAATRQMIVSTRNAGSCFLLFMVVASLMKESMYIRMGLPMVYWGR